MHIRRSLCAVLAAACLLGALAVPASAAPMFPRSKDYTPGQFADVALNAWFTPSVATVYELGLMQGYPNGAFCPGGNVSLAETITLAARLYRLYRGDNGAFTETQPWYRAYVDYALENDILAAEYPDYDAAALRRDFAVILAHAFPTEALPEFNAVENGQIPDVPVYAEGASEIYTLYRAGILVGNDEVGTFAPTSPIRRSEVAAIAARMADPELRLSAPWTQTSKYPDLTKQSRMEDDFFVNSAMLGNSLAQGMMLCSGIKNMKFYCYQSTTVFNPNGASPDRCYDRFLQGKFDRVYLEYGINEMGSSKEDFIAAYRRLIGRIREVMPEAEIYIMAITPVTQKRSNEGVFTMKKIGEFNDALYALAKETECWYLDSCTLLCDATGYLPAQYAGWDGSPHLAAEGYTAWAEIIRCYYA